MVLPFRPWVAATPLEGLGWTASVVFKSQANVTNRTDFGAEHPAAHVDPARLIKDLTDLKFALDQSAIVATTDVTGRITYVNDRFCKISKYSRAELIGKNHRIINSGYHPKEFFRELWRAISAGEIWHGEIRNRAKDGSLYWVDTTIVPFLDPGGHPYQYMAIRFEITERKRAEAKLLEQQTLARLGEMSAVVAHEVKNPLAGISGALQIIESRLPPDGKDRAIIGEIQKRIDSLNHMVQDLLLFARPTAPALLPTAIGDLLAETTAALCRDPALGRLEVEISGANPTVRVDREQMRLALQNLLINAAQAMDGRGTIHVDIATGTKTCDVCVTDHGPGLSDDIIEEMFEPFFTTKHRGSGLGLPTARRIVEAHGGQLTATNRKEGGAVLRVSLPVAPP